MRAASYFERDMHAALLPGTAEFGSSSSPSQPRPPASSAEPPLSPLPPSSPPPPPSAPLQHTLPSRRIESYDYRAPDSAVLAHASGGAAAARCCGAVNPHHVSTMRWLLLALAALLTGATAVCIDYLAQQLTALRQRVLEALLPRGAAAALAGLAAVSLAYAVAAALPTALLAPEAAGSGIPEVKVLLNGSDLPYMLRLRTIAVKAAGLVGAVASGLPVGKEGPLVFVGAGIAASLARGKRRTLGVDTSWSVVAGLRNDREKRDMAACGAAAGVAAAFGAPIGGVLFAVEEGASHWFRSLLWRTFFCAIVTTWVLELLASGVAGSWGSMGIGGLFAFGVYPADAALTWQAWELPLFVALGALGGLVGAAMVAVQRRLATWRARVLPPSRPWLRIAEVAAAVTLVVALQFLLSASAGNCVPLPAPLAAPPAADGSSSSSSGGGGGWRRLGRSAGADAPPAPSQALFCAAGEYNDLASILLVPGEQAIRLLFHFTGSFSVPVLALFTTAYFATLCLAYGLAVPAGVFIPALLTGCGLGRLLGELLLAHLPGGGSLSPGLYALIGAAAVLGGVTRMTISLAVILMETTGNVVYALPLLSTLMTARFVGNLAGPGLYDLVIELRRWPLLGDEPDAALLRGMAVRDIMSAPPDTLRELERADVVLAALRAAPARNAWPLVFNGATRRAFPRLGSLAGLITRRELAVLLARRAFHYAPSPQQQRLASSRGRGADAATAVAEAAAAAALVELAAEPRRGGGGGAGAGVDDVTGVRMADDDEDEGSGLLVSPTPQWPPESPAVLYAHGDDGLAKTPPGDGQGGGAAGAGEGAAAALPAIRLRVPMAECAAAGGGARRSDGPAAPAPPMLATAPLLLADDFASAYPRWPSITRMRLTPEEKRAAAVDMRPYMTATPFTVHAGAPAERAIELFRSLGLRHLVVIDDAHDVVGIITRHDILDSSLRERRREMEVGGGAPE